MASRKVWEKFYTALKKEAWPEAISCIDQIIHADPDNPNNYLKKGDIYRKGNDTAKAVNAYLKAALCLGESGFHKKALAVYKMVLRIDPDNKVALDTSHNILRELENSHHNTVPSSRSEQAERNTAQATALTEERPAEPVDDSAYYEQMSESGFLSPFTVTEIKKILSRSEIRKFSHNDIIVHEGDTGDSVFIIKSGTVAVKAHFLGRELNLAHLSPGDLFGEVAYLTGRPRTADVIAEDTVEVYELNRVLLDDIIEKSPEIMTQVSDVYNARVTDTIKKIRST